MSVASSRLASARLAVAAVASLALLAPVACSSADALPEGPPATDEPLPAPAPAPPSPGREEPPPAPPPPAPRATGPHHLRYLAINIGNVSLNCRAYEYKLCTPDVSDRVRDYIATWKPDVVLLSEVLDEPQLDRVLHDSDLRAGGSTTSNLGGPVLPPELGYAHACHSSLNRFTGVARDAQPLDDPDASHRHECVAWRKDRFALVDAAHVLGPNTPELRSKCHYDFTMQAATLRMRDAEDESGAPIDVTGIAVHPASDTDDLACRKDTIARMWSELATKPRVFVGGDFNTGVGSELMVPSRFHINYSHGNHFATHHAGEFTAAYYVRGEFEFDHAFSSFGRACTDCGKYYGGSKQDLPFGSALGDWDGHPWAAKPGIDHRQILVDLTL